VVEVEVELEVEVEVVVVEDEVEVLVVLVRSLARCRYPPPLPTPPASPKSAFSAYDNSFFFRINGVEVCCIPPLKSSISYIFSDESFVVVGISVTSNWCGCHHGFLVLPCCHIA